MNHLIRTTLITSITASTLVLSVAAHAATVEQVLVGKAIENIQTSSTNVQVNPAPQGPLYGGPYDFHVNVGGQNVGSINAPTVTGPMSVGGGWLNGGTLIYDSSPDQNQWRLGINGNDWGSPTLGDLNAHFGSGVYDVNVNGTNVSLNLTGDAYPNTPMVTLSGGFWSGGKYLIDPNQALTITTNTFTAFGTHADDYMGISLGNLWVDVFHSTTPGSNFVSMTIPGSSLIAGQDYQGWSEFAAVVDVQPNTALPGSLNAAYYSVGTGFVVSAVPVPAAAWLLGSGLLGLIGVARRKAV